MEGFTQTQVSTLTVKDKLLVAGGFQGELICKVCEILNDWLGLLYFIHLFVCIHKWSMCNFEFAADCVWVMGPSLQFPFHL